MTIDKVVLLGSEGSLPTVRPGGASGHRINRGQSRAGSGVRAGGGRRTAAGGMGSGGSGRRLARRGLAFVSAAVLGELGNFWDNDTTVTAAGAACGDGADYLLSAN